MAVQKLCRMKPGFETENPPQTLTPSCSPTVTGLDVYLRSRPVSYVLLLQAENVN